MAFPSVAAADSKSGTVTSNTTSWTLTYPTNLQSGDLILAFIAQDGTGGATWPAGFVDQTTPVSSACQARVAKKVSNGTETGNFTVTLASEQGCWRVIRIPAAQWHGTLGTLFLNDANSGDVPISLTSGEATSGSPTTPSLDPNNWAAEDTLWITVVGWDGTPTCTGFPTNYTQEDHTTAGGHTATSGGAGGAGLAVAYRKLNASSEDPGTFTLSGSEQYNGFTIAVRPAAATVTLDQSSFRFYEDGTESGSTAIDAQDTNISRLADSDSNLQLRLRIQNGAAVAGAGTDDYQLQYSKNGGAYTNVGTGAVVGFASANTTDGGATTNRLGAGTGSFVAGEVSEDGLVDDSQITASNYQEHLYALTVVAAQVNAGDTLDFRVQYNGSALNSYTLTPRITVTKTATVKPFTLLGVG